MVKNSTPQGPEIPALNFNLNINSRFVITESRVSELNNAKRLMRQSCGSYGIYIVELDSYRRASKIAMKETCRRRMMENLNCLPAWDCKSLKDVQESSRLFLETLEANRLLMGGVDSHDSRYDGIIHYDQPLDEKRGWKKALEFAEFAKPRPIIFVALENESAPCAAFTKNGFKNLHVNNTPNNQGFKSFTLPVIADSIYLSIDKSDGKRGHTCVPEFDTYLDWCKSRLKLNADAMRDTGLSVVTFDDVKEMPLVLCEYGAGLADTTREKTTRTDLLNVIAFAEYVAEVCGSPFVHYQESLY